MSREDRRALLQFLKTEGGGGALLLVASSSGSRSNASWYAASCRTPLAVTAWYCTYRSGIHPTIAAVALGLLTPAGSVGGRPG